MAPPGPAAAVTLPTMPENLTDPSHSTEQFRAFVQGNSTEQFRTFEQANPEPERSWGMNAPRNKVLMLSGIIVAVAIVIALISLALV